MIIKLKYKVAQIKSETVKHVGIEKRFVILGDSSVVSSMSFYLCQGEFVIIIMKPS